MRLYVGGLPYQTQEQDLRDFFEQVGQVSFATVITDRETGRSKGFGFVEFENEQDAHAAIDQLNGAQLGGRTLTVNEARERPAGGNRGGGYQDRSYGGGGGRNRY
ncbi:RNA recognition motif domain-containing protein [Dictyobacter arantiisoli]|uniref:RNA-binding protein n=1 Tax=Dictyobacter arantiisoli TaxID=2014874 RepID=A0A5A5TIE7_9CHLR|nr:RNA-binding protein [Dictyobacter arantiisoli]GCF11177.1 RNA-binding protein [Dictyobacter arantiisoli]